MTPKDGGGASRELSAGAKRSSAKSRDAKDDKGKGKTGAKGKGKDKDAPPETGWDRTKANLKTIGGAVLLAIFIRIVLFEAFEIEGPSMEPTLLNGDRVVVSKFSYGLFLPAMDQAVFTWAAPEAGDVVIVKSPHDGIDIVKRVIGVPGDRIEIRDDVVYRNGHALDVEDLGPCAEVEPYLHEATSECKSERIGERVHRTSGEINAAPTNQAPLEVPPGHVFILGDHRDRSNDSRFFGTVPIAAVKGRALGTYWSSDSDGIRWDRFFEGVN
jgi:signal peptidase I